MAYSSTQASLNYLRPYINTHCGNLKRKNLTIMKKNRTFHVRPHSGKKWSRSVQFSFYWWTLARVVI